MLISISKKTNAPKIVGILNKKANLEASFKFKPMNNAAVIAVPDLEAPGKSAKTWNNPINKAHMILSSTNVLLAELYRYAKNKNPEKIKSI